ncbi:hypothetical protein ANN_00523 [Periplaneta americana]|uniref:Gustatory receptor n=1 Tax=Periplaneta americana TaxID=6978 RepID=A0ABQ8TR06_PERAM|nr:hypothetical protein ANN_00523 [Periplaneta americana]
MKRYKLLNYDLKNFNSAHRTQKDFLHLNRNVMCVIDIENVVDSVPAPQVTTRGMLKIIYNWRFIHSKLYDTVQIINSAFGFPFFVASCWIFCSVINILLDMLYVVKFAHVVQSEGPLLISVETILVLTLVTLAISSCRKRREFLQRKPNDVCVPAIENANYRNSTASLARRLYQIRIWRLIHFKLYDAVELINSAFGLPFFFAFFWIFCSAISMVYLTLTYADLDSALETNYNVYVEYGENISTLSSRIGNIEVLCYNSQQHRVLDSGTRQLQRPFIMEDSDVCHDLQETFTYIIWMYKLFGIAPYSFRLKKNQDDKRCLRQFGRCWSAICIILFTSAASTHRKRRESLQRKPNDICVIDIENADDRISTASLARRLYHIRKWRLVYFKLYDAVELINSALSYANLEGDLDADARTCKLVSKSETEVTGGQEGRKEARRTGNMCPGVELTDEGMYGLCLRVVSKMTPSQVPKEMIWYMSENCQNPGRYITTLCDAKYSYVKIIGACKKRGVVVSKKGIMCVPNKTGKAWMGLIPEWKKQANPPPPPRYKSPHTTR